MPEEAIAGIGKDKRHGCLGIAVGKLKHAVFDIQKFLLVLAHTEQLFFRLCMEGDRQFIIPAQPCLKVSGMVIQRAPMPFLFQKEFPLLIIKAELAAFFPLVNLQLRRHFSIRNAGVISILYPDISLRFLRGKQGIIRILNLSRREFSPHGSIRSSSPAFSNKTAFPSRVI